MLMNEVGLKWSLVKQADQWFERTLNTFGGEKYIFAYNKKDKHAF